MPEKETATTSKSTVKGYSTRSFNSLVRKLSQIEFVRRNKTGMLICLAVWLVLNVTGYLLYRSAVTSASDTFYQRGVANTQALATKSRPLVLENDVLALNLALGEVKDMDQLAFAAVVDHNGTVLVHTDPAMMTKPLQGLVEPQAGGRVEEVEIERGLSADKTPLAAFSQTITFSEVEIGKVYLALATSPLDETLGRYKLWWVVGAILGVVALIVILVLVDRSARQRARTIQAELEGMTRIGPYVLHDKIAQGGMAELFKAEYIREDGFRKQMAVKRILPHLAENEDFIKMFTREARVAAVLQHQNIVQISDYGKINHAYFIAMEFVNGKHLGEVLKVMRQGLPVEAAMFIGSEICKGLHYSHTKKDDKTGKPLNIVHRDISPQNIMLSYRGEVKISDFGISKASSEPSLTQAGVIKGKLSYLSPEQTLGEAIDHQADIYALGLVLHEMLTGDRVYRFETDIEALRSIPTQEIEPVINLRPEVPEGLNQIVMTCLAKDRAQRYQHAEAIQTALVDLRRDLKITYETTDLANFMKRTFESEPTAASKREKLAEE
jgi:tRNA A-37 threonylcarbamoyl transferase component Bud32